MGRRLVTGVFYKTGALHAPSALWDESTLVAEWAGVDIGEDGAPDAGRVVKIDLTSRHLSCMVPAELGRLTALTGLYLFNNQVTSVPAELGSLVVGRCRLTR
jgi:Leucine-rich repeat (LRR) protein